jgi:hypothetical protein
MSNVTYFPEANNDAPPSLAEVGNFIARIRRGLRLLIAEKDHLFEEAQQYRRCALTLKEGGNPFHRERIRQMEATADGLGELSRTLTDGMRMYGRLMRDAAPTIDASTTLEQRCELLNVNIADRGGLSPSDGVNHIVFKLGLEDSAARRRCDFNDGPLFRAQHLLFADFLATPEGQAVGDSLFQPGGLFEWLPTYSTKPDGALVRNAPCLRAAGSTDTSNTLGLK